MLRITSRAILGQMSEDGTRSARDETWEELEEIRGNSKKALTGVLKGMLVKVTLKQCEKAERAAGRKEWCILKIYRRG